MQLPGIRIDELPALERPVVLAAFDGWGNALNVARGTVAYLIRRLGARPFARLLPDTYYRYDHNRPVVTISDGEFRSLTMPGGEFFFARPLGARHDLVLLEADEPELNWERFAGALMLLCRRLKVEMLVTVGSMYDGVLHTDRLISGVANKTGWEAVPEGWGVTPISYQGPSAVHSALLAEACRQGVATVSLWGHCPYYLQGTTHLGQMRQLGGLLAEMCGITLDMQDLDQGWEKLREQVDELIRGNPKLQQVIAELRKRKVRGTMQGARFSGSPNDKVIHLKDFIDPDPRTG